MHGCCSIVSWSGRSGETPYFFSEKENDMYYKLIVSLLLVFVAVCSSSGQTLTPTVNVPDKLRPRANESIAMIVSAKGSQIYECRAKKDKASVYEWAFVAPEADLFNSSGKKIGRHYAGPHWESTDGSKISGTVKESADAPQADAIPWLLLVTKSVGSKGSFSQITSIQRVNTVGGVAPKTGCSQSTVGTMARIPYTADYYFLSEK
jgi:hypothetical protein